MFLSKNEKIGVFSSLIGSVFSFLTNLLVLRIDFTSGLTSIFFSTTETGATAGALISSTGLGSTFFTGDALTGSTFFTGDALISSTLFIGVLTGCSEIKIFSPEFQSLIAFLIGCWSIPTFL